MFKYIADKYGADKVGQIATVGKMGPKTAIRDLCRVLEIPYDEADRMSKLIPDMIVDDETEERDTDITLAKALAESEELRQWRDKYPKMFEYAEQIEGLWKNSGIHAAGVVISPVPLADIVPLARNTTHDYFPALQLNMHAVEALGLIKMDFLGLKTLDVIWDTIDWIGIDIDWTKVPMDDPEVYKLLKSGKTLGIFQIESYLFRDLVRQMQPDNFKEIAALIALGRPGPIDAGMDKVYIARKHGMVPIEYPHPALEEVLKETYGIFVYQEDVMTATRLIAGFTPLEADGMRKAMGKKEMDLVDKIGKDFISRAVERGEERETVENLWHQMETFGRYGLTK